MDYGKIGQNIVNQQSMINHYFDNLQNVYKVGAKGSTMSFQDMVQGSDGGVVSENVSVSMKQGVIKDTKQPTHMAINGNGFFMVNDGDETQFTRAGDFRFNESGNLVTNDGKFNVQGYQLDENGNRVGDPTDVNLALDPKTKLYGGKYTNIEIDDAGKVYGVSTTTHPLTGQKITQKTPVYQVAVANFSDPTALKPCGASNFAASNKSGDAVVGVSGEGSLGKIVPHSLEMSNIDTVAMTMKAIEAKMAYNSSFAVFKTMDKMTQMAMQLIR